MDQMTAVLQAQKGDKESFRFLVETYQRKALSTALFLTRQHHTAEDVVQEAFVQCYLHLSELRDAAQFIGQDLDLIQDAMAQMAAEVIGQNNLKITPENFLKFHMLLSEKSLCTRCKDFFLGVKF